MIIVIELIDCKTSVTTQFEVVVRVFSVLLVALSIAGEIIISQVITDAVISSTRAVTLNTFSIALRVFVDALVTTRSIELLLVLRQTSISSTDLGIVWAVSPTWSGVENALSLTISPFLGHFSFLTSLSPTREAVS